MLVSGFELEVVWNSSTTTLCWLFELYSTKLKIPKILDEKVWMAAAVPGARSLLFARNLYIYWSKSVLIIIWRFQLNCCHSPVCLSKAIHSLVQACVRATRLGAKIQTTCHPYSHSCNITLLEMETTHTALYTNRKFCIYIWQS